MEDLEKTDSLYWENIVIENKLHKIMLLIEEDNSAPEKKEELKERAYERFLKEVKTYKGCPRFQTMTVDELKEIYKKFRQTLKKEEEQER